MGWGFILGMEVTAGNIHDSIAWDGVYDQVTAKFEEVTFVVMDAGYKTPWIAKKTLEDGRVPIMPYTRYKGDKERYKPWEYTYDPASDTFQCPRGGALRHTTTDKEGKRTYRSTPANCKNCPCKNKCGANEKGQKVMTTHIWQEYLDLVEAIRMRYTHHRGLAAVTRWVRLKYAAMNLKKLAKWSWNNSVLHCIFIFFPTKHAKNPALIM